MASAQIHSFSGYLPMLHLPGGIELPTYFVVISLTFSLGVFWFARRAQERYLARTIALDLSLVIMAAGFLGARLVHVVFEEPAYYAEDFTRVFAVWRGGFVWYGGALAAGAAVIAFARWKRIALGVWVDAFAPVGAVGYAMGRFACFLTGCCFGKVCALDSGFAFRYPTQLFAVFWELAIALFLLRIDRRGRQSRPAGTIFFIWIALHAVGRIIMEAFRDDPRGPAIAGLSLGTWLSAAILIFAGLRMRALRDRPVPTHS